MTSNLSKLVTRVGELAAEKKKLQTALAGVVAERKAIVQAATGADDQAALDKLAILSERQALFENKIALAEQEQSGLDARLLDESARTKKTFTVKLLARRVVEAAKVEKVLESLYPSMPAKDRKKFLDALIFGARQIPQPDALRAVSKALTSFGVAYEGNNQTPEAYARQILGAAERALKILKN